MNAKEPAPASGPDQDRPAIVNAQRELARLNARIKVARGELARLRRQLGASHVDGSLLVEANQQMVAATIRAQLHAEATASQLEEVSRLAGLDVLTGLPNRLLMRDRLSHAIANAKRHRTRLALLFVDLDDFKRINDTLGHAVGDRALELAAQCLVSVVREVDSVSRHGGDEFLILLDEVSGVSDAVVVANKVIAALDMPKQLGDRLIRLKGSVGISIYPDDGEDEATLITRADAAMYRAKRHSGSSICHGEKALDAPVSKLPAVDSSQQPLTDDKRKRRNG